MVHIPIPQDTTTQSQSLTLESTLGAPGAGTAAHLSIPASQILKIRETIPEAWAMTGRIMLASAFLATLLSGKWAPMSEAELAGTGLWNHTAGAWDDTALELVGGGKEEAQRLRRLLGDVEKCGSKQIGLLSPYFVERYGMSNGMPFSSIILLQAWLWYSSFSSDVFLIPFTSEHLATYLSLCPAPTDIVLSFGGTDVLMTGAPRYIPSRLYYLHPHPAQSAHENPRYIATLRSRNADIPRALVRDMYTKSWSAFDRLVSVIPPGGSIGYGMFNTLAIRFSSQPCL
jgi:xylulokinase